MKYQQVCCIMNEREVVNMMENEKKAQMIIVNKSAADDGIQIHSFIWIGR